MITQTATGYLLRRVIKPVGPGRWWTYVLSTATLEYAKSQARAIAAGERVRALVHRGRNDYELIEN